MPISETFQDVPMMGHVISVPVQDDAAFISVQIQRNTATPAEMDAILQELVDLLQTWENRPQGRNVNAQRYLTGYYDTTPTNPDVIPVEEPEPEPEDQPAP